MIESICRMETTGDFCTALGIAVHSHSASVFRTVEKIPEFHSCSAFAFLQILSRGRNSVEHRTECKTTLSYVPMAQCVYRPVYPCLISHVVFLIPHACGLSHSSCSGVSTPHGHTLKAFRADCPHLQFGPLFLKTRPLKTSQKQPFSFLMLQGGS